MGKKIKIHYYVDTENLSLKTVGFKLSYVRLMQLKNKIKKEIKDSLEI